MEQLADYYRKGKYDSRGNSTAKKIKLSDDTNSSRAKILSRFTLEQIAVSTVSTLEALSLLKKLARWKVAHIKCPVSFHDFKRIAGKAKGNVKSQTHLAPARTLTPYLIQTRAAFLYSKLAPAELNLFNELIYIL
jgi:hypothetical protein